MPYKSLIQTVSPVLARLTFTLLNVIKMRNIIVSMNVTADGFMAGPDGELNWHFEFWDDEMCDCLCEQLYFADTILLGKNTYNALARYWANRAIEFSMPRGDIYFAQMMNNCQKVVCSKTINPLIWINSTLIKGPLKNDINILKQKEGKNIITYGSGTLVSSLFIEGVVDRLELWVHPVKIKSGVPFFKPGVPAGMVLSSTKLLRSGVKIICYDKCY